MSIPLGQTLAGLLNASFGNAVEIIVGVAALLQGKSFGIESLNFISSLDISQMKFALSKPLYVLIERLTTYLQLLI